jgi:hypothetical protein
MTVSQSGPSAAGDFFTGVSCLTAVADLVDYLLAGRCKALLESEMASRSHHCRTVQKSPAPPGLFSDRSNTAMESPPR